VANLILTLPLCRYVFKGKGFEAGIMFGVLLDILRRLLAHTRGYLRH
jgi:hypothetical protein